MAQCKWCGKRGMFMAINADGLCRTCLPGIQREVIASGKIIQKLEKLLDESSDIDLAIQHCDVIINKAREVMKYEEKGIPTYTPLPSKIVGEYAKKRDKILLEVKPEKISEALEVARSALDGHRHIAGVARTIEMLEQTRELLDDMPWSTRIAAFINLKGGVGKTTTTMNVGHGLARLGKQVFLIDLDPQANLTDGMGYDEEKLTCTVYNLLKKDADIRSVILDDGDVSLIPASVMLTRVDDEFADHPDARGMLRSALKGLRGYDYILIDCPPSLGFLSMNALTAARDVYVPLLPEYFSLKGVRKVVEAVDWVKRSGNPLLTVRGIIGTRYDRRKRHHEEVISRITAGMGGRFYGVIRENIAIAEASSHGKSIYDYKPRSAGADDYLNLCREIIRRDREPDLEIHDLDRRD